MIVGLGARLGGLAVLGTISVAIYLDCCDRWIQYLCTGTLDPRLRWFGLRGSMARPFFAGLLIIRAIGMSSSPLKAFVMRRPQLDDLENLVAVPVTTRDKY